MKVAEANKPFVERLYELDESSHGIKRAGIRALRYVIQLFSEVAQDEVVMRASGLAYVSLLGLVPLLALVFSLFSSFGSFAKFQESMRAFLLKHLIPSSTEQVIGYIEKFLANTKALSLIGVVSLLIVAVFIFNSIESAFNRIWMVKKQRSMVRKFLVFSAVVVWGPVFIGASIYAGSKIKAIFHLGPELQIGFLSRLSLQLLPVMLTTLALFLAYLLIPNTRVRLLPAFVGAVVAGVLWELAKSGFNAYVKNMITYKTVYGSLAVIPLFLIWLYVTWVIVLFGAEITFTTQNFDTIMAERLLRKPLQGRAKMLISLKMLKEAARRLDEGNTLKLYRFSETLKLPYSVLKEMADLLVSMGYLRYTNEEEGEVTPAVSPDRVSLAELAICIDRGSKTIHHEWLSDPAIERALAEIEGSIKGRLGSITLSQWARGEMG
ncbi:MAG TPA: YihY family inner membrane protein [Proteobacteria bacterium]|nr:YihY family inner membrane protein [Pseudomonadota bacterium]